MRAARLLLACSCRLAPSFAEERGEDALRRDIEFAREQVFPALVNISVVTKNFSGGRMKRFPPAGSGVIVSPAGHVLTNYLVAADAVEITCRLPTNEAIPATVIAHDPLTDLSVLKLSLDKRRNADTPLPFARLGDSDALRTGDYVLAMGNPLALSSSITLGIVSNPQRVFSSFTGTEMEEVDLIENLCYAGQVPVIPSMCVDDQGQKLNVNADTAAMAVAQALGAEKLIFMSGVNGGRRDKNDPSTLMHSLTTSEARQLIASGVIESGMIPKVEACLETISRGVRKVHIIDGRVRHSLLLEIYTTQGVGTEIING